jgi:hypothetical protein
MYINYPQNKIGGENFGGACKNCSAEILRFRKEFAGRVKIDIVANN